MGWKRLLLVTGISGAGRSTTLKMLEEFGYQVIDNLPIKLLRSVFETGKTFKKPLAIGLDVCSEDFDAKNILKENTNLSKKTQLVFYLLFLDCSDDILQNRFRETRRRHPLAVKRTLKEAIKFERQLLSPLRDASNEILNTSLLKLNDLRPILHVRFSIEGKRALTVFISSFSFRFGLPRESDMVFDVRFLSNPFYIAGLEKLSGLDQRVGEYISKDRQYKSFFWNSYKFV